MPFKFALGKARRYNVSSRNAYVVCVNMLDNQLIECTLTADGTGHDCLQNIAQRIHLNEIYYFGLQYVNKKLQFRWLDLDRPVKKQLDKSGHSPLLYFRVMFYVADVQALRDNSTRYQYYLQLKLSVIDGKLPCSDKQAVLLGAYSLQAEFGNHDPTKHTLESLHDYILLPRNICTEQSTVLRLTHEMLQLHRNLQGLPQDRAELQYIIESQQLESYGLDYFPAKDTGGQEILLGASFIGIFVKYLNGQPVNYFKWSDINNLTCNKKNFNIETSLTEKTVHFHMDDPDMVKYVFKMCSLQHKFYHSKQHAPPQPVEAQQPTVPHLVTPQQPLAAHQPMASQSMPPQPAAPQPVDSQALASEHLAVASQSPAKLMVQQSTATMPAEVGSTGPLPDIQQSVQMYDAQQSPQLPQQVAEHEITSSEAEEENLYENSQVIAKQHQQQQQRMIHDVEINPAVVDHSPSPHPPVQPGPQRVPSYRPAPDYESIMRQRMDYMALQHQQERTLQLPNIGRAQVYAEPELLAYSQPEMSLLHQRPMLMPHNSSRTGDIYQQSSVTVDRTHSLIIQPTYSTPELYNSTQLNLNAYKLPPPYPRSSNSFPDLATMQQQQQHEASPSYGSPDLVSRKNLANVGLALPGGLERSVDNLAVDFQPQQQPLIVAALSHNTLYPDMQQNAEQEVLITDPPNPSALGAPPPYMQPAIPIHYAPENPYENLPPAYISPEIPLQPPPFQAEESIDCIDTSNVSAQHSATSSSSLEPARDTSYQPHLHSEPQPHPDPFPHSQPQPQPQSQLDPEPQLPEEPKPQSQEEPTIDANDKMPSVPVVGGAEWRSYMLDVSADETRAPKDERRKLLEMKLAEGQVFAEFELIPKKRRTNCVCSVGERRENDKRNRFKDILPYDDSRVVLQSSKENPTGYINASHIKVEVKNNTVHYISAQGPMENTVKAFWQMVWEQNIHVIAMLTGLQEGGKEKCFRYWPQETGIGNKLKFGEVEVYTKLADSSTSSYITSRLTIRKKDQRRQVWHLQYTGWPDHGCPEDTVGFQCYLEEIESVRRQAQMEGVVTPTLVHCSAGVGRSGVLILSHIMRNCLDLSDQHTLVDSVLEKLREQRMHMVQTVTQYTFVYNCLVNYLKSARLI